MVFWFPFFSFIPLLDYFDICFDPFLFALGRFTGSWSYLDLTYTLPYHMCLLPRQRLESSQLTLASHIFNFPVANCYHLALLHKGKKVIFYLGKHFTIYGVIELAILLMKLSWYKILYPIPHKINWTQGGQKVAHGAYELFRFRPFNSLVLSYQSLMTSPSMCVQISSGWQQSELPRKVILFYTSYGCLWYMCVILCIATEESYLYLKWNINLQANICLNLGLSMP